MAAKVWLLFNQIMQAIFFRKHCGLVSSHPITILAGPDTSSKPGVKKLAPHEQTVEITPGRA